MCDDDSRQALRPRPVIQKTHAAFVSKLYAMVADAGTDGLIAWTADGDCFKVTDPAEFSREVLPAYFKHGNWQSFVRQLNMYGFHKVSDLAYGGVFGDTQLWLFKHACFQRGQLALLQNIKRRGTKTGLPEPKEAAAAATPAASETTETEPADEARGLDELKDQMADLQQANAELRRENQEMRSAIVGCQGAFGGIMRFLETAIVQSARDEAVVDAFRRLSSDVSPIFPPEPQGPSFRPGRYSDSQSLPPLRPGIRSQPDALARLPSLSPPALAPASCGASGRKRCLSSGSTSSSSNGSSGGDSSEAEEVGGLPPSSPRVVLPPISGMIDGFSYRPSESFADKPSSLRDTLSKRPKLI
ncbi:Flocculation suppression protein [Coemansia sp. RSA 552]|nr:Flocculation suppression protein [Coemansia sp. RSA 552]